MNVANEENRARRREWDTRKWRQAIYEKTSLMICKKIKNKMEKKLENKQFSDLLFKCRTNNLKLMNRN